MERNKQKSVAMSLELDCASLRNKMISQLMSVSASYVFHGHLAIKYNC
jgi:hypothetical protein